MKLPEKYKREAESMLAELEAKAAKLRKRIVKLREGSGALTTATLHEAQTIASIARDIEISIYVSIEARRKGESS